MSEQLEVLTLVATRLDAAGIAYMLIRVWLASAEDLILSKLPWAKAGDSAFQLRDVRNLIRSVEDLDWSYVERWAPELTVSELLSEVRS